MSEQKSLAALFELSFSHGGIALAESSIEKIINYEFDLDYQATVDITEADSEDGNVFLDCRVQLAIEDLGKVDAIFERLVQIASMVNESFAYLRIAKIDIDICSYKMWKLQEGN